MSPFVLDQSRQPAGTFVAENYAALVRNIACYRIDVWVREEVVQQPQAALLDELVCKSAALQELASSAAPGDSQEKVD